MTTPAHSVLLDASPDLVDDLDAEVGRHGSQMTGQVKSPTCRLADPVGQQDSQVGTRLI